MFKQLLRLLLLIPALSCAQGALIPSEARKAETTMAEWLAHPAEFGVKPKRTTYLASVETKLAGEPHPIPVHVIEYVMPDGTYGRGFVNPVTWSFIGPLPYSELSNTQLVTAYSGWLWLFSALNNGRAESTFKPQTLPALLAELQREGVSEVSVNGKYRVSTSEFFEFSGVRDGRRIKGAGSAGSKLVLEDSAPLASLPLVYTYLGMVMRGEIR